MKGEVESEPAYLILAGRGEYEGELCDPVGEPAEDVDGDDGEDEAGDLPVGLAALLRLVLGPHRLQLDDHQDVEGQDEQERHCEAQHEAVEGERRLPVEDMPCPTREVLRRCC